MLLPRREQSNDRIGFYQMARHELARATGHPSRLNRCLNENRLGTQTGHDQIEALSSLKALLDDQDASSDDIRDAATHAVNRFDDSIRRHARMASVLLLGIRKPDGSGRCRPGAPWRQGGTLGRGTGISGPTTEKHTRPD